MSDLNRIFGGSYFPSFDNEIPPVDWERKDSVTVINKEGCFWNFDNTLVHAVNCPCTERKS